jgi:PKD repeat protein
MNKIFLPLAVFIFSFFVSRAQLNEWTWVNGDVGNAGAVVGSVGVFDSLNHPAPYYESNGWVDNQGHFWYFSTDGYLWEYSPYIQQWRFVWSGASNQPVFGAKGVPSATNEPGHRAFGFVTWTDAAGDLWFFSGYCGGTTYADMWRYNIATNMWTWMSGSSVPNDMGVYGTMGVPSTSNYPMGRCETNVSWVDSATNELWMYGGDRAVFYTSIGDLWKYNIATDEWTWMHGDTSSAAPAVYGVQNVPDPLNSPGARLVYCKWSDLAGNFYLFAGSADVFSYKNDTWKYDPLTNQWTWTSGPTGVAGPGVASANCTFDPLNTPPSDFENKSCWTDYCGNGWVFGRLYNSVWTYRSTTSEWSLVKGNANSSLPINYGVKGVSDPSNNPEIVSGAVSWRSKEGEMYFLNHGTNSVMWRYKPDPACSGCALVPTALFSAPHHICPGTCTDFTNLSLYATSYQWTFTGGVPATSTDVNPLNICYNSPGTYSVQLIATSATGTDTLTLNNYVTVYPYPAPQGITQSGDTLFANQGAVSYQWYLDGSLIAGATDYFYVAMQVGNYNVVATDANGCEVEAVIFDVVAGLETLVNEHLTVVYPNPVTNKLTIHDSRFTIGAAVIRIYSMLGELAVQPQTLNFKPETNIEVSGLGAGIYWIELQSQEKIFRAKFVKQ